MDLIDALHVSGEGLSVDDSKRRIDANIRLERVHQRIGENIGDFYEKFNTELEAF